MQRQATDAHNDALVGFLQSDRYQDQTLTQVIRAITAAHGNKSAVNRIPGHINDDSGVEDVDRHGQRHELDRGVYLGGANPPGPRIIEILKIVFGP